MEIVEMVLAGKINMEITDLINRHGGSAVGLRGKDGGLILSKPLTAKAWAESLDRDLEGEDSEGDFGLVGDIEKVDPGLLRNLQDDHYIPVIAPIGTDREGNTYNINADTMAGAIAAALGAARLFLLTDVAGVLDKQGNLLTDLTPADIAQLQTDGTISGGMIPKLETCIHAVEAGCEAAVVLDGRVPHAMLIEVFTARGAGTLIRR